MEDGEGAVGSEAECLGEYAEDRANRAGADSADILWPPRRGLLHLRCQRQTGVKVREQAGRERGVAWVVLLVSMESSLVSCSLRMWPLLPFWWRNVAGPDLWGS